MDEDVVGGIEIKWFEDSPSVGDPECVCSVCGEVIDEDHAPCVRLWGDGDYEARFHVGCFKNALDRGALKGCVEELSEAEVRLGVRAKAIMKLEVM